MTNGRMILDSNIIIDLFKGDSNVVERIKEIKEVCVPVIVIGELYFGANKSSQTEKRILEIEKLERAVIILNITKDTARIYGEIKDQLKLKGKPIPENDIWIAAITKESSLTLLTNDRHFEEVEGISIEKI